MKKTDILKKNYEFRYVLTKGRYYSGKYIEVFYLKNKFSRNKIGIAIKTKIRKSCKKKLFKKINKRKL